ncbi:MAG: oligosaccharide flippase family protein [Actinomycetota bacterium]
MSDDAASETQPDPRDNAGRVARNIASVAASQLTTWLFSAVAIVIVPRALGPVAIGQLGLATAIWQLGNIAIGFGSHQLIIREMSQDPKEGSRVLSNVVALQALAWVGVSVLVAAYAVLAGVDDTVAMLLVLVGLATIISQQNQSARGAIIGRERLGLTSSVSVIERAIAAGVTIVAVVLGYGVVVVTAVAGVATVVALGAHGIAVARDPEVVVKPTLADRRSVIQRAIPLMLLSSALLLYREIDVLALAALADEEAVGLYAATDRLFGAMVMVPSAISLALFPTLARRFTTDPEAVRATLRRLSALLGVVTLPMAVGAWMLGPDLAVTILGEDFEKSGDVMRVYGIVLIPVAWTVIIGMYCTISKQERVWTFVLLASAVATVPLDIFLVPFSEDRFDNAALAGAIAFLVTETSAVIFGFRRVLPGVMNGATLSMFVRAGFAAAAMAGVLWAARDLNVFLALIVGGGAYGIGALAFGALRLSELATLGGPFQRLARFGAAPSDGNTDGASSTPTSRSPE